MHYRIERTSRVEKTPRVQQVMSLFDVPPSDQSSVSWDFELNLPDEWSVGLVVGPSGSGKTTAAREIFGGRLVERWDWPADRSVLDGFPAGLGIKDVTELMSSVGFSSPPAWLRPYHVLSNGEKFRVDLARTLAESPDLAVVDEFSSVVDRQVAQVGSAAVAKTVRRRGGKFVAVSCHYDILEWLDPDWVFEPHNGQLTRRSLQGRPGFDLAVHAATRGAWPMFKTHHYMSQEIHPTAACFVGMIQGRPVAFASYIHLPHPKVRDIKIAHRLVVLPDFQGVGIGARIQEWIGEYLNAKGYRFRWVTAHPALIAGCGRSPRWRRTAAVGGLPSKPKVITGRDTQHLMKKQGQARRLATHSFEYVPVDPA